MHRLVSKSFSRRTGLILGLRLLWAAGIVGVIAYNQPPLGSVAWTLIVAVSILGNGLIASLILTGIGRRWQGALSFVFDLAYMYFSLSLTRNTLVLITAGSLAVLFSSLIASRLLVLCAAIGVVVEALQILGTDSTTTQIVPAGRWLMLLFIVALTLAVDLLRTTGQDTDPQAVAIDQLRAARERLQSAYRMLSITNDVAGSYQQALADLLRSGLVDLQQTRGDKALRGAVLLIGTGGFSGQRIYMVAAHGLNPPDQALIFPGQQGMLALALRQTAPIVSNDPQRDPELRSITGLAGMQTLVAIPLRQQHRTFGILLLATDDRLALSDDDQDLLGIVGAQLTATLQQMRLYQESHQDQTRLIDAEEEARKKLARDLHDGPAQSIALIAMRLNYIRALAERTPDQLGDELYKTEEIARRTSRDIRHMLFTLRPLALETQGLTTALRQFADKMQETHQQAVIIEADPDADTLFSKNIQGVLFYIAEEAVGNARKHAQAPHIYVRLRHGGDQMILEIQDDGKGFDVAAVTDNYEKRGSLGMINMRERTEMINGFLAMTSAPGKGTQITVTVPLSTLPATDQDAPVPAAESPVEDDELTARLSLISPPLSSSPDVDQAAG